MKFLKLCTMMFVILLALHTNNLFGQAPNAKVINPVSGSPGQVVIIKGKNLADITAVKFGSLNVTPSSTTEKSIKVTVPNQSPGVVPITLVRGKKNYTTNLQFVIKGTWKVVTTNLGSSNLSSFPVTDTLPTASTTISNPDINAPLGIAIHPDGTTAYSVNSCGCDTVNVTDIGTSTVVNTLHLPGTGGTLRSIAIDSVGKFAYVTSQSDGQVYALNIDGSNKQNPQTTGNFASTNPADIDSDPTGLAISSDDQTLYVINQGSLNPPSLTAFDLTTSRINPPAQPSITLPAGTYNSIALTPRTSPTIPKLYIANEASNTLIRYNVTNRLSPSNQQTIVVAGFPGGLGVSPTSPRLFIPDLGVIHVVSTETDTTIGDITVTGATNLYGIAIAPDDSTLFVTERTQDRVYAVPNLTPPVVLSPPFVPVGITPTEIAITPDQSPLAGFEVTSPNPRVGDPVAFSAAGLSGSPVGEIATYQWDFDDGTAPVVTTEPTVTHTYNQTGNSEVMLTVTNTAGTSAEVIFPTGQEISNNGSSTAIAAKTITVQSTVSDLVCPPTHVEGFQFRSFNGKKNIITWEAPQKSCGSEQPVSYRIFLDAGLTELLATIPAESNEKEFRFVDSKPGKGKKKYFIVSVDESGNQSLAVKVVISGRQRHHSRGNDCCGS